MGTSKSIYICFPPSLSMGKTGILTFRSDEIVLKTIKKVAKKENRSVSNFLNNIVTQYVSKNEKQIKEYSKVLQQKHEQKLIHSAKFTIVRFWKTVSQLQMSNYLSQGKADYECFRLEVDLLAVWYDRLPQRFKKLVEKNFAGIQSITKQQFEEMSERQLPRIKYNGTNQGKKRR